MMRSMYTAVSGLRTHQGKMDTIGNNIANVNTVGFKRGQVTFKDAFSQTMTGATAPNGGKGGINPTQIGMGVSLGSINTIHTVGNGQKTDNPTDLMINGEGFFTVSDDVNFNNRYYTRAGNFSLDRDGNLVTQEGFKVLGYTVDKEGNVDESIIRGIRINKSDTVPATTSSKIQFRGNLDSNTDENGKATMDTIVYDSLGNEYKITFQAEKTEKGKWELNISRFTEVATGNYVEGDGLPQLESVELEFNTSGKLVKINGGDTSKSDSMFDPVKIDFSGVEFNKDSEGKDLDTPKEPEGVIGKMEGTSSSITIFDAERPDTFNKITQYANETDLKPYREDGNTSGTLDGFTIDATGTVVGIFTNGEQRALGQLMLTKFDNPVGLEKIGNNMFTNTRNSGEPQSGMAGGRGFGPINGGTLEMSNVDISFEFTEMITTQRGFQANSRVITTSDEMLQELVNIKR